MRDRRQQQAKENAIKTDYENMARQKIYSRVYICDQLSLKYHLQPSTVERIVWGEYDTRRAREAARRPPTQQRVAA
ncbi:hypothetical protein SAMN02745146_0081 [Hymenobacter daecheongensis DSM 21074]|uniref:Uncharacterized protein n=1 Tax=Hymenobacter daecheongensis DSM 21074 TaxID=1121955 RepID=A0A1M6LWI7_9BACT|nr:hypothetical protein [Hymenobacter daecheongensis]SHJ75535.1 hypothetical protein SAMN02745146_0081 [Hymenobacter daecheongensis DSM 21074]